MTGESVGQPSSGEQRLRALRLGLGAVLLAAAWVVASFFLGTGTASAAEPPVPSPPGGLLSSAVHSAGTLAADLDRGVSTTLSAVGVPAPAVPTPASAPAAAPVRPVFASALSVGSIPAVQRTVDSLSNAAAAVQQAPSAAPVRVVTDAASGLVSDAVRTTDAVAGATDTVLPTLSAIVVGPVTGSVHKLLDTVALGPVADLPGDAVGVPKPSGQRAVVVLASGSLSDEAGPISAPIPTVIGSPSRSAHQPQPGARPHARANATIIETEGSPGSLPGPSLPLLAPNAPAATASTDGAGSTAAAAGGVAADVGGSRFSPPPLLLSSAAGSGPVQPASASYDWDSTPD